MKNLLILTIILAFNTFSIPSNLAESGIVQNSNDRVNTEKKTEELKFNKLNCQGILIGDKIELLNDELKIIDDISDQAGEIVNIVAVSDSIFHQSGNFCNAFWYVKIKSQDKEGIVNGRQIYKILNSRQNASFIMEGANIEIFTTEFFGIGVEFEGDLMGCPVNQPVVIKDTSRSYFGLVTLIPNEFSKQAVWDNDFPFFQLKNDDGAYDNINYIWFDESKIILKIKRGFQEGENEYDVALHFNNNKYTAEYINYREKYK